MITQKAQGKWRTWAENPRMRMAAGAAGYGLAGFCLSGVSLLGSAQPLAMGLTCALTGWRAAASALGSLAGYRIFWPGESQGIVWTLGGCLTALFLGKRRQIREAPLLMPAMASFLVSAVGLAFQMFWKDQTSVPVYLLRVALAGVTTGLWPAGQRAAAWLIREIQSRYRKGGTAMAQVRLEIMAGVLNQTRQLMLELPEATIDEEALLARTRERACGSCPVRKTCTDGGRITTRLLHEPLTDTGSIPCRKPSRMLTELRRSQEQLRQMGAERKRREEYRGAVMQQYQFLGDFLRDTSDALPKMGRPVNLCFRVDAEIVTGGKESDNGDICQYFDGPGGCFYMVLCDGMGTGMGAAQEARTAMAMLRKMLTAGFPAEYALGSINSLCCLRGRAGAVTVDLLQIQQDTGKAAIYKWGAAPSYLLTGERTEKIGTAGPPPGLSLEKSRETVDRLSLRRGEVLILISDGVDAQSVLHRERFDPGQPLGEIAAGILEAGWRSGAEDATVAAIRLHPST